MYTVYKHLQHSLVSRTIHLFDFCLFTVTLSLSCNLCPDSSAVGPGQILSATAVTASFIHLLHVR